MAKNLIVPEKIKLQHIEVIKSDINDKNIADNAKFNFSVAHNTKHNLKEERVKVELFINLLSKQEKGVKFQIDFHFVVLDLKDHYNITNGNKVVFSSMFIATLLGISFSTARGVVFQKLQDTNLKGVLLPIVSPYKILKSTGSK